MSFRQEFSVGGSQDVRLIVSVRHKGGCRNGAHRTGDEQGYERRAFCVFQYRHLVIRLKIAVFYPVITATIRRRDTEVIPGIVVQVSDPPIIYRCTQRCFRDGLCQIRWRLPVLNDENARFVGSERKVGLVIAGVDVQP